MVNGIIADQRLLNPPCKHSNKKVIRHSEEHYDVQYGCPDCGCEWWEDY